MNDAKEPVAAVRQSSGWIYLLAGMLVAVSGMVIYIVRMQAKVLSSPWYVPVLATLGALLIVYSLAGQRTIWRWGTAGLFALLAAGTWFMFLVGMAAPPYTGPVTVGRAFPNFETKLAGGTNFSHADLQGDQNTILLFFRGRW